MSSSRRGKRQQAIEEHLTTDAQVSKRASEIDQASGDTRKKQGEEMCSATERTERLGPTEVGKGSAKPKAGEAEGGDGAERKPASSKDGQNVQADDQEVGQDQAHKRAKLEPQEGTSVRDHDNLPENTLEQGRVFFMYKPRVTSPGEEVSISGLNDIQRTYLVLQPEQSSAGKSRLLVLPKKKLPDPGRHEKFFAFVEAVASSPSELTSGLKEESYSTKTRGERVQPAARAVGEGVYVIAKGGKRGGVHWGYKLEVPQEPGEAQAVLGIRAEGSYVLSAKNPAQKGRPGVPSAGPEPKYTPEQREQFSNRSWIDVEDPSLLDVAGTELLLVGAKADPIETGELGEAGELLQQLSDGDEDSLRQPEQQEQLLKEALEPELAEGTGKRGRSSSSDAAAGPNKKGKAVDGAEEEPIPVKPAVTGNLE